MKYKAIKEIALKTALGYLEKDPEKNMPKLMNWVDKLAGTGPDSFESQRAAVRAVVEDPTNNMHQLILNLFNDVDRDQLKVFFTNFILNANILGWPIEEEYRKKYNCNIPWVILLDPTSACNLHCTGCWAAEYGNKLNLSYDELASVVRQGRELGVYFYMFTGGEPLVRKKDIIRLCGEFSDCQFLAFTNGTLVDQAFCDEMKRVGNLMLAISLEGEPEVNDLRRGQGVYGKVMYAMELLKANGLIFGTSICYTSSNCMSVTSPEFVKLMVEKGCRYAMYFHYMPVGNEASPDLMPSPEQRMYIKDRIRHIRRLKDGEGLFTMDFQNDGEFVGGCIAGGRNYFHINANGDAEPCVFIHYSNANIRTSTLLEILKSPLFMAYRDNQPFNENHLRPCPMLENPEILQQMVAQTGAKSTDLQSPESAEHLCGKCAEYAAQWKPCADKLWAEEKHPVHNYENYKDWKPKA